MHYVLFTMHYVLCIHIYTYSYVFTILYVFICIHMYSYVFTISCENLVKSRDFGTHA